MRIEHTLDIDAPAERVFALTIDIERWPQIMPTVTTVERLDTGPLQVGSKARLKQPGQGPTVWTVDAIEPGNLFVWQAKLGVVRMTATHEITPTASGCRNRLAIDLDGPGANAIGRLVRKKVAATLATENECFRREATARTS